MSIRCDDASTSPPLVAAQREQPLIIPPHDGVRSITLESMPGVGAQSGTAVRCR